MSTGKAPNGGQKLPPPIDPKNVDEVFADEIFSVAVGGGICTIVAGKRRITQLEDGALPVIERRITSRLVLSIAAANDLLNQMGSLKRLGQQQKTMMTPDPVGPAH